MKFCGEIQYTGVDDAGNETGGVHSDICWNCGPHKINAPISNLHREFLHACLDEWLDKSKSTGAFWIGDPEYFKTWFTAQQVIQTER